MSLRPRALAKALQAGLWTAILALSATACFAQMNVAEITGIVTDPSPHGVRCGPERFLSDDHLHRWAGCPDGPPGTERALPFLSHPARLAKPSQRRPRFCTDPRGGQVNGNMIVSAGAAGVYNSYLMFQPNLQQYPGSIPVPLATIIWNWSGGASYVAGNWVLIAGSGQATPTGNIGGAAVNGRFPAWQSSCPQQQGK